MFQDFAVKNFRCFSGLLIRPLARVNLIAGKNNTGKTALLEALQIHSYPQYCELPFTVNQQRGADSVGKYGADAASWLFYDRHGPQGFQLSSQDEKGVTRTLSGWLCDAATARRVVPDATKMLDEPFLRNAWSQGVVIVLRGEVEGQVLLAAGVPQESRSYVRTSSGIQAVNPSGQAPAGLPGPQSGSSMSGLSSISSPAPWAGPSVFLGSCPVAPQADLEAFSQLEAQGRQAEVVTHLQILEPRLTKLALLLLTGKPVIHGDIGLGQLVPVPFMGEGIRRLLSILLAVATAKGGRVLIDEIENGLHYSVQVEVWKAIAGAARAADVQVFATTHSWECVQAAHHAFKQSGPYELRFHRLDRHGGQVTVKSFDERMLDTVEKSDLEVR
jgi:hypothetical protein